MLREEELLGDPVDLLAAEFPRADGHAKVEVRVGQVHGQDLNAVSSGPSRNERLAAERGDQFGLAGTRLADEQHLRLILRDGILEATKIRGQDAGTSFVQLEDWPERVAGQAKLQPAAKRISKLARQRGQLIAFESQP